MCYCNKGLKIIDQIVLHIQEVGETVIVAMGQQQKHLVFKINSECSCQPTFTEFWSLLQNNTQYTIILVTLCSESILILQPNLISNVFHIRTMNLSWFWIHATMYNVSYLLILSHLSVFHGIWNFSWFCLHISPLTPFFFILSQRCKGDNWNWLNKILHWNLLGQYQPIILRDLT